MTIILENLPNKVVSSDFAERQGFNTVFGETVVGWHNDDISLMFQYNNSTRDVTSTVTGSGVISNSLSRAVVGIGAAVGTASVVSVAPIRYRPGHEAIAQFTSLYDGAQAGVNQYHGILNGVDGFTFGTKDGVFGVWFIEGGVETFTPRTSWNGDKLDGTGPSGFVLDQTKLNIYMITFGWFGIAPAVFAIYTGPTSGWAVCHILGFANTQATPHLDNPSLPISARTTRTAGSGTAASIATSSWRGGVTGGGEETAADRWFAYTLLAATITAAVRNNVFTLRNNATFQGKTNHVVLEIAVTSIDNNGNKTVAFYATKGATLTGASAYAAIDAANSIVDVATGGTVTGGTQGASTILKAGADRRTDVRGTGFLLYPGETLTFEAFAAVFVGDISFSARWVERF